MLGSLFVNIFYREVAGSPLPYKLSIKHMVVLDDYRGTPVPTSLRPFNTDSCKAPRHQSKVNVAKAAAVAVAAYLRPISFTDNKVGMNRLEQAIFHVEQSTPVSDIVDSSSLLPSAKTVSLALSQLSTDNIYTFLHKVFPRLMQVGGAAITDGVTIKVQDKTFYDFTVHYIECEEFMHPKPDIRVHLRNKTTLLREEPPRGDAARIRAMLDSV